MPKRISDRRNYLVAGRPRVKSGQLRPGRLPAGGRIRLVIGRRPYWTKVVNRNAPVPDAGRRMMLRLGSTDYHLPVIRSLVFDGLPEVHLYCEVSPAIAADLKLEHFRLDSRSRPQRTGPAARPGRRQSGSGSPTGRPRSRTR